MCFWLVLLAPALAEEQEVIAPEEKVKAAFIFNFTKFVEWPSNSFASASSPLVIGVLGKDLMSTNLEEAVAGRKVHGRPVAIARYKRIEEATNCHVLYITSIEKRSLPRILATLNPRPVLTVGETEDFNAAGGLIRLVKQNEQIHFTINAEAVARSPLKFNSKLLRLGLCSGRSSSGAAPR